MSGLVVCPFEARRERVTKVTKQPALVALSQTSRTLKRSVGKKAPSGAFLADNDKNTFLRPGITMPSGA